MVTIFLHCINGEINRIKVCRKPEIDLPSDNSRLLTGFIQQKLAKRLPFKNSAQECERALLAPVLLGQFSNGVKYTIKSIHLPVSFALTQDVERKIVLPLKKLLGSHDAAVSLMVELLRESRHHRKGAIWTVRLNLNIGKNAIRIEQSGEDIHEAVDLCAAELREDVKKFKERTQARAMRGARKAVKDMKMNKAARSYRKGRILEEGD